MRRRDLWSGAILFCLALFVLYESRKFHLWGISGPGEGLFPLLLASALGGLSLASFVLTYTGKSVREPSPGEDDVVIWRKLISYMGALVVYTLLFDMAGFVLSSLVVLIYILRFAERLNWTRSLLVSGGSVIVSYLLFDKLLQVPLPKGILLWP